MKYLDNIIDTGVYSELPNVARIVLPTILSCVNPTNDEIRASERMIMSKSGLCGLSVRKGLKLLVDYGVIELVRPRRGRKPNVYKITTNKE